MATVATPEVAMNFRDHTRPINVPSPRPMMLKAKLTGNLNETKHVKELLLQAARFPTHPSPTRWTDEEKEGGETLLALVGEFYWTNDQNHERSHLAACRVNSSNVLDFFVLFKDAPTGAFSAQPAPQAWSNGNLYIYPEWRRGQLWTGSMANKVKVFEEGVRQNLTQQRDRGHQTRAPAPTTTAGLGDAGLSQAEAHNQAMHALSLFAETRDPGFLKAVLAIRERVCGPRLATTVGDHQFALTKLFMDRDENWDITDSQEIRRVCKEKNFAENSRLNIKFESKYILGLGHAIREGAFGDQHIEEKFYRPIIVTWCNLARSPKHDYDTKEGRAKTAKISLERSLIDVGSRPPGNIWNMVTDRATDLPVPDFARHITNVVLTQTCEEMVKLETIKATLQAQLTKCQQNCASHPNQPPKTIKQIAQELRASDDLNHVNELVEQLITKAEIISMTGATEGIEAVNKAIHETELRLTLLRMRKRNVEDEEMEDVDADYDDEDENEDLQDMGGDDGDEDDKGS